MRVRSVLSISYQECVQFDSSQIAPTFGTAPSSQRISLLFSYVDGMYAQTCWAGDFCMFTIPVVLVEA